MFTVGVVVGGRRRMRRSRRLIVRSCDERKVKRLVPASFDSTSATTLMSVQGRQALTQGTCRLNPWCAAAMLQLSAEDGEHDARRGIAMLLATKEARGPD
jgi:hypothetical protein